MDQPEFKPTRNQLEQNIRLDQPDSQLEIGHGQRDIKVEESNGGVQEVSAETIGETGETGERREVSEGAAENIPLHQSDCRICGEEERHPEPQKVKRVHRTLLRMNLTAN